MQSSSSMHLPPGWYAILLSKEISSKKPISVKRFGLNLVVWRTKQSKVIVLEDKCPHRGAKLSLGRLIDDKLECPFHGFQFNTEGRCAYVPELQKPALNLCAHTFQVQEKHGFVWINWRKDENTQTNIPWFHGKTEHLYSHCLTETWNVHFTRSVENQLDFSHLCFVHKTSIGRFSKIGKMPNMDFREDGLKFHFANKDNGSIEFLFPNVWLNFLSQKYMMTLAFAPVDDSHTKLYLQVHRAYIKIPPFSWIVSFFEKRLNQWVLSQDRRVVESQGTESALDAHDVLFPSDKLIRHFREWFKKNQSK